jgi:putative hemolysin
VIYFEIAFVAILILLNGLLAMSELAVVSARPTRLKLLADRGNTRAGQALALHADPGRFLSTVQIGITLVGVLSGAFSGATLGLRLVAWLMAQGLPEPAADAIGVGSVVAVITYASLIIGELVPKQIALRNPERVAIRVAPAMTMLAKIARPFVTLLDVSGSLVLRLMGQHAEVASRVTSEEIKTIVAEAESAGVLQSDERRMISGVLRLGERPVRGVMTPRTSVDWIDLSASEAEIRQLLLATQHARLPVGDAIDGLVGVAKSRELLAAFLATPSFDFRAYVRAAPVVYDNADALDVLATLRSAEVPMALVHDEYGHFEGVVTPADILEVIVGAFRDEDGERDPPAVRREDGSWLLSGRLPADELADHIGIMLPENREYQTTAGFVLSQLQRLPRTGDHFSAFGWRFEVVDMDGRRIDKVLAQPALTTRRPAR